MLVLSKDNELGFERYPIFKWGANYLLLSHRKPISLRVAEYISRIGIFKLKTEKIVITGGPSTGKTSVIKALESRGYLCIHEFVREMTAAEKQDDTSKNFVTNPILSVKDPAAFNTRLIEGRIAQYRSVEKMNEKVVFFDRGIPDVHSYMNCFGQSYDKAFEQVAYDFRYDRILLMPPWREIYTTDAERFETYDESERIFKALEQTYQDFDYKTILIPKSSVAERTDFILDSINNKL